MNLYWLRFLALAVGSCGVVPFGHAAETLRLEEAVARALASNPSMAAEAADLRAAQARADRDGLSTPFSVGGEIENFAGTGAFSGIKSVEATLRLGRVIELGDKRAARQALGSAEVARQRNASEAVRLEISSRTTTRFIEVAADQHRLEFAREQVDLSERTRREVAKWVAAARNPESELRAAEIAVAVAELDREHAEHELASARTTLSASWGAFEPDFESVVGDLQTLPPVEPFEVLAARLPMTATQRSALLEAGAIEARRRVAVSSARPDITASVGIRRFEAVDDHALVMSVSLPLGSRNRAGFAIAEADAQLAAVQARSEAQRFESHQALFEKYQELKHAATEYEALQSNMLGKAEQALAFTRRGFEAGRFSFVALSQAQRTLFDLRKRSVDAAARYHTLLVEVERLTTVATEFTP